MADIDTSHLDADTDKVKPARAALLQAVQRVNNLASTASTAVGAWLVGFKRTEVAAAARTVSDKLNEYVSVLDFGADPTGVSESTDAFDEARATGKRVFAPKGTYRVSDIAVVSDMWIEGEADGRTGATVLEVCTNNTAAFHHSAAGIVQNVTIKNLRIKAASGVTGAKAYRQDDKSTYLASTTFENVETCGDLVISYDGFFIITRWENCIDGYRYDPPSGQQHQMIRSVPAAYGQANQTNLCQLVNTHVHRATSGAVAAVEIAYGSTWSFIGGTHFEDMDTLAISAEGILHGDISGAWFENIRAVRVMLLNISPAPNAQGSRIWTIADSRFELYGLTGTDVIGLGSACTASVDSIVASNIPTGVVLTNAPTSLIECVSVVPVSGAGVSGFLTNMRANRSRMNFSDVEMTSDCVNSPQSANQNVLPIGPGGLGHASFSISGISAKSDVASGIGLAGQAVQFTLGAGSNIATVTLPAKLATFLRGKTVTLVLMGYAGTANVSDGLFARIWDTVLPDGSNGVTDVSLNCASTDLQVSYVTATIAGDSTAIRVGLQAGGVNSGKTFILETMALYLGRIKPEAMSIR